MNERDRAYDLFGRLLDDGVPCALVGQTNGRYVIRITEQGVDLDKIINEHAPDRGEIRVVIGGYGVELVIVPREEEAGGRG